MKLIDRNDYLNKLIEVIGTPDIKVITGIRRAGKSKLLETLMTHVSKSVSDANIIHVDFNLLSNENLMEYHALQDFIDSAYKKGSQNYVFIDEVQMCNGFEKTINSLHAAEQFDIYITGSNAFLLGSDLATLFTGRTFEVEVFPFSLAEYMRYFDEENVDAAFEKYTLEGGMSGSYPYRSPEAKYKYIADIFDTLIIRDIRQKYQIRNVDFLEHLSDFMMDNISNLTSARSIADALVKSGSKVNDKTVNAYLKHLCSAFAFYKIRRYDIRGKKYLSSGDKYYLCDHSFKYAKLGTRNLDYGRTYENMIAIELLRRGYEVYAGVLYEKEIDFVAMRQNEKFYIQVSDNISSDKTLEREYKPLLSIKDAYPKLILANTKHETYTYEGIEVHDIARWLSSAID